MKTTSIPNAILTMVVAVFATIQVNSAVASSNKKMEAVLYNNTWIPSCNLKAVEISALRPEGELVQVKEFNGALIPSVSLPAVTIKASGVYTPADVQPMAVETKRPAGHRVAAVKVNGEYIPHQVMAPVTISASPSESEQVAVTETAEANATDKNVFNISTRKTFDVLMNIVVEKVLDIVHNLIGSGN